MKSSATAHPNIALIKYWGNLDPALNLPLNGSLSMVMGGAATKTTIEFSKAHTNEVILNGKNAGHAERERVESFINIIKKMADSDLNFKLVTENDFPTGAGLASSASGFAALTTAASDAMGLRLNEKELSIIARQGSGSACRSIPSGFVEWHFSNTSEGSYAEQVAPPDQIGMRDIVAVTDVQSKAVPSSLGHPVEGDNPFLEARLKEVENKLDTMRRAILSGDFQTVGKLAEHDCLMMHAVMMTSRPPLLYLSPSTILLIDTILEWREAGLECYFTIDAGPNVHVLCMEEDENEVAGRLNKIEQVKQTIVTRPGEGAGIIKEHLF